MEGDGTPSLENKPESTIFYILNSDSSHTGLGFCDVCVVLSLHFNLIPLSGKWSVLCLC